MTLPRLLLVDDSDAVLEIEQEVLGSHYRVVTARDGREALARVEESPPDAILLDLSMPELDGDEVLARLRRDPRHAATPVVIISSEGERARACLARGAQAALEKPVRSEQLIETVGAVLAAAARERKAQAVAVLPVQVGPVALALPLAQVEQVTWMAQTLPLPGGPAYLSRAVEVRGAPVALLDLAWRLGVGPGVPVVDQRLVLVATSEGRLAINVDRVLDPEEAAPESSWPSSVLDLGAGTLSDSAVRSVVRSRTGALWVVVEPLALLPRGVVERLGRRLAAARAETG